jgi:hypothetical protein
MQTLEDVAMRDYTTACARMTALLRETTRTMQAAALAMQAYTALFERFVAAWPEMPGTHHPLRP